MASITEIKNKLPKEFIENLYSMFSAGVVDDILRGISCKRYTTIRVNTIKYNIQDLMSYFKKINIKFERVLWYSDALIIKNANEQELQKLDIYKNGFIYIQSLPSMIPPLVLNPKKNEKVLDLTAAPGSKTTELAALMQNKGYILANELDKIRCERLKYNVESQGASIIEVINGRGEYLGQRYEEKFDKVLLDTPCSGEGRFDFYSVQSYRSWSSKTVSDLAKMQKKLFKSAYLALKKGGTLVYSTCTINKEENEEILSWALDQFKDMKLEKIELNINKALKGNNNEKYNTLDMAIRFLPSIDMEGFFVAKFKKM